MKLFLHGPSQGARFFFTMLLSLILMYYDVHESVLQSLKSKATSVFYPLEIAVTTPVRWLQDFSETVAKRKALAAQNADLQAEIILLKAQLQKLTALQKENEDLRALLKATSHNHDIIQIAEVISINQMPFVQEFLINAGKKQNVYVGQPVVSANGLVGQVIATEPNRSRVLLLTDSRSAIPVEDSRTGIRGIIIGTGATTELKLIHIPTSGHINPGDLLVTSGLDGQFPAGYPVGVVQRITRESEAQFDSVSVKPIVDVNRVRLLLLVWEDRGNN